MFTIETITIFFFVNDDYYEEIMTFNGVFTMELTTIY